MTQSNSSVPWLIKTVALLSTGSEILQGQYADTNARFLAEQLTLAGINVTALMAAPDDERAIEEALRYSIHRADIVICTGGLGPTRDDVNRFVFERLFQAPLCRDEKAVNQMARRFVTRGLGPMPEANEVQALLPEGCIPLYNRWGTAPGFLLPPTGKGEAANCGLLALPGPPSEMVPMFRELAMPELREFLQAGRSGAIRTIHTYGHPESEVGMLVNDLFEPKANVEFSILAKRHGVDLRIRAICPTQDEVNNSISEYEQAVRSRIPASMIYGVDDETLAEAVGRLLKAAGARVTTAESCTGGMIAELLTDTAGSSAYVGECHVTYSNDAKVRVLGVDRKTLNAYGAVSREVATEMAEGARKVSHADYALSVTGIAGPDGGSVEKPVGLTYIGLAGPGGTEVTRHQFTGDRGQNRISAAQTALNMLRLKLLGSMP